MFFRNLSLALEAIIQNKFRAFLTTLGILFGVAAVIAMLAIGKGAEKAIIEQLKFVGTNNIVLASLDPSQESSQSGSSESGEEEKKKYSPGLQISDLESIQKIIPSVLFTSPELELKKRIIYKDVNDMGYALGIWNDYLDIFNLSMAEGNVFLENHHKSAAAVCIVGSDIKKKFFKNGNCIGEYIKFGHVWLKIIGVLNRRSFNSSVIGSDIKNLDNMIFIPAKTAIQRIENKLRIDASDFGGRGGGNENKATNYHQLQRGIIQVSDSKYLQSTAEIINKLLQRRHNQQNDVNIEIPELLIKQKQSTQKTFNLVLAIIAGISLIVGGIGIMNIMLASVMERIKEIGIRRSLGATQKDIIWQFLLEAILISLLGGIMGVILGVLSSYFIARSADIPTVFDIWSILLAFSVAVGIGVIFGYIPSQKAAKQDPVIALRTQ